jgi:hypothetical protein
MLHFAALSEAAETIDIPMSPLRRDHHDDSHALIMISKRSDELESAGQELINLSEYIVSARLYILVDVSLAEAMLRMRDR